MDQEIDSHLFYPNQGMEEMAVAFMPNFMREKSF